MNTNATHYYTMVLFCGNTKTQEAHECKPITTSCSSCYYFYKDCHERVRASLCFKSAMFNMKSLYEQKRNIRETADQGRTEM